MKYRPQALIGFIFSAAATPQAWSATINYNLNVEIIQVFDDAGSNGVPLFGSDGGSYLYESQVNEIWNQAGIQVTFSTSSWNNTEAQRLTSTERSAIYNNSFTTTTGDPLPGIGTDRLQLFFVFDHPGTGYNGTAGSGWVGNPLVDPNFSARNAGNAQLYISGTFSSNGRAVMANEGFTSNSLSGTITHEIGHALGLRHVEDVNGGDGAGTTQDPDFGPIADTTPNLMWGGGMGPDYSPGLDNDPGLTALQENFLLTDEQINAAIFNGLDLDPDGNGVGVLQLIPEPGTAGLTMLGLCCLIACRRR